MSKLLIIKSARGYLRFVEKTFSFTDLNKASVYPFEQISDIKEKIVFLHNEGIKDAQIRLLTIIEEPFQEDE